MLVDRRRHCSDRVIQVLEPRRADQHDRYIRLPQHPAQSKKMLRNAALHGHCRQTIEGREAFRPEVDIAVAGNHIEASALRSQLASRYHIFR